MGSSCEVESIEDILIAVLVRLPAKSIFRFRCVSKKWYKIIATPFFLQASFSLRKACAPKMVAYIQGNYKEVNYEKSFRRGSDSVYIYPMPFGPRSVGFRHKIESCYFVNSSCGLVLFEREPHHYLIFNPITNKKVYVIRQQPPAFKIHPAVALVCEENTNELVPVYKIVVAGKTGSYSPLSFHTFCSKTNEWTISTPIPFGSLGDSLLGYSSCPLVVDGIIHWLTSSRRRLVVYYVDSGETQIVELPSSCWKKNGLKVVRSSRDYDLWLCMHNPKSRYIKSWMLPRVTYDSYRGQSDTIPSKAWIFMHTITYPDPSATRRPVYHMELSGPVKRMVPHRVLIKVTNAIFRVWNLADRSYIEIPVCPSKGPFNYYLCMEALSLSSYAL